MDISKKTGKGSIKILILVSEEDINNWYAYFDKQIKNLSNLEITLFPKSDFDKFKHLIEGNKQRIFVFILDLSKKGNQILGYGDRALGILNKSLRNAERTNIDELDETYGVWYAQNFEFSTLQIGTDINDFGHLIESILSYFNGDQK